MNSMANTFIISSIVNFWTMFESISFLFANLVFLIPLIRNNNEK